MSPDCSVEYLKFSIEMAGLSFLLGLNEGPWFVGVDEGVLKMEFGFLLSGLGLDLYC